jgi:hypothetical protein
MRRRNYLSVILTINAALLAGLLWVQVADQPLLAGEASAQSRTRPPLGEPPIVPPNAASQRAEMISELKKLGQSMEAIKRQLDSGVKAEVTNLDQIDAG